MKRALSFALISAGLALQPEPLTAPAIYSSNGLVPVFRMVRFKERYGLDRPLAECGNMKSGLCARITAGCNTERRMSIIESLEVNE
jgi:hypothetical protein